MKRVSLKQQFTGEPTLGETTETLRTDVDEADLEVQGGWVVVRVPATLTDEEIVREEHFQDFMRLKLQLEQGRTLEIVISEGANGVDVRLL